MFHLIFDILKLRFFARDQNLSVIGILYHYCVFDEQTQVVGEDAVE